MKLIGPATIARTAVALAAVAMTGTAAIAQVSPAPPPAGMPDDMAQPAMTPDPVGGYQPSTPLMSGTPMAGQPVIFRPSTQTPSQAYPAPAPLPEYPPCRAGQTDDCMQRGG
jgi:hypothetical protein